MSSRVWLLFTILLSLAGNTLADILIDDFESYTSNTDFQAAYLWNGGDGGGDQASYLDVAGGVDGSKAMRVEFSFSSGSVDPMGWSGGPTSVRNWSEQSGINLWVKTSTTGPAPQYFRLRIHEGASSGSWGDKFQTAAISINTLDQNGQYVSLDFDEWIDYGGFGGPKDDGILDLSDIRSIFIIGVYFGTASESGSATILVDDITVVGGAILIRPPYLQNVTQTSVDVMWGSNDTTGTLYWGSAPGNYSNSVSSTFFTDNDGDLVHTAVITGLTAGETVYYYVSFGINNIGLNDSTYFAVAAPDGDASFSFIALGDTRPNYGGNPDLEPYAQVLATMIPHKPAIVLHTGDIAREGYVWEFNNFYFTPTAELEKNTPVFPTLGNHELRYDPDRANRDYETDVKNYRDLYSLPSNNSEGIEDYYSFDYGMVHFISLNTELIEQGNSYWDVTREAEMKTWLETDLAATTKPWKVVFFHKPAYLDYVEAQEWDKIFENNGVDLVLQGHIHNYDAHYRNNVTYIATGGGGSPLGGNILWAWPDYNSLIGAFRDYHFTRIDVTPEKLHLKVYSDENVLRHWIEIGADGNVSYPPLEVIDNFEAYENTDDVQAVWEWNYVPPEYAALGVAFDRSLSVGGTTGSSNVIQLDFSYPAGSADAWGTVGVPGLWKWKEYTGLNLWLKVSTTGDTTQNFQLRLHEPNGGDKWVATMPVNDLDPNGENIYLGFNDFGWYGVGDPNSPFANNIKELDNVVAVFVGASASSGTAVENSSATIWIDDITSFNAPKLVTHLDDDFENYADNTALLARWNNGPDVSNGGVLSVNLDLAGGVDSSHSMEMDFSFSTGADSPGSTIGYSTGSADLTDLTDYTGIELWLRPKSMTGDEPYFTLHLLESSTAGGEKWKATLSLGELDNAGEYLYLDFGEFYEYFTDSGNPIDLASIETIYLGMDYDGVSGNGGSAILLVDDIAVVIFTPSVATHLDDDFENYANDGELAAKWNRVYWGGNNRNDPPQVSMTRSLDVSGGTGGSKAMRMDFTFQEGVNPTTGLGANWEPCIYGITGYYTDPADRTDLTEYSGVSLWIKPGTITGNEAYFKLNFQESSTTGEEKWISPKVVLTDLDSEGQYVYLDFDNFYEYFTGSGQTIDLSSMKITYLWLAYDNTSTASSAATIFVDDITYVKEPPVSVDQQFSAFPMKYTLYQNYPNPFNPVTTIRYNLPEAGNVQLIIYDILGREVIQLVNDRLNGGRHSVKWNGRDKYGREVAGGVYIYRIKTEDFVTAKKLVLLK